MKRKRQQQDLPAATSASGAESWLIVVLVGGGGDEVRVSMAPDGSIGQLLKHVRAEKGVRGALVAPSGEELQPMHTLRASGLAHEAEVYLQIREAFEVEKQFLIALKDSTSFESWNEKIKAGWEDLDGFTEPQQLSACAGVAVGDGEITALDLTGNRAIERKPAF